MIASLLSMIETETGVSRAQAGRAYGLLIDASRRQGGAFGGALCAACSDSLALADAAAFRTGTGACDSPVQASITALIEATPGGRRHLAARLFEQLRQEGFGPLGTTRLVQIISTHAQTRLGLTETLDLGALLGGAAETAAMPTRAGLRRSA